MRLINELFVCVSLPHRCFMLCSQVQLYTLEQKSMLSFKIECEVDVPAHRAFDLLAELSNRPSWDSHYK